jgi:general secretion pathway protein K
LNRPQQKGTALLAVLWLTAALSMIAMSVADSVRSEIERGIGQQEALRAYYLARGAVEESLFRLRTAASSGMSFDDMLRMSRRRFVRFPSGEALVEIVSEQGKLNMRSVDAVTLARLLVAMGEPSLEANQIASTFGAGRGAPMLNANLLSNQIGGGPSAFSPGSASLENVEELMLIPGVTSEMMHGRFRRQPNGRMARWGGLVDCISPLATSVGLDAWSVDPTLLVALGMSPDQAQNFVEARALPVEQAMVAMGQVMQTAQGAQGLSMNAIGTAFQIRATARPRLVNGELSETRRTVALLVENTPPPPQFFWRESLSYLRWYDQAESTVGAMAAAWLPVLAPVPVITASGGGVR